MNSTLNSNLTDINTRLTNSTNTNTLSFICGYSVKFINSRRVGNICSVNFDVRIDGGYGDNVWTNILTISDTNYRPTETTYFTTCFINSDRNKVIESGAGKIDSDGKLYVIPKTTTGAYTEAIGTVIWMK